MSSPSLAQSRPAACLRISDNYKWWVVFMLWFVCFFNYADRQALSSVLPLLKTEFKFDPVQLGWLASAFAAIYSAGAPVAGLIADRMARKRLIVAACIVWSFFTLATAWSGGFMSLLTVRALTGLGETFYFPAAMALISDYHSKRTRSRAMAWHQSAVYAGTILGSWIAALLAERYGWRVPFLLFGPFGVLLAVVLSRLLREPQRGAAEDAAPAPALHPTAAAATVPVMDALGIIFRTPAALLLMGAFVCANFVAVIFLSWTPFFLVEKFHYKIGAAGLTGTLFIHLASAVAVPVAGALADRLVQRLATGRMVLQCAGLVVGSVFVFLVAMTGSTTILVVTMACYGACKGFYDSGIFASLYDVIEPHARGTAAGLMNAVGWFGGFLGPIAVGWLSKHGRHASEIDNMSEAIALCSVVYIVAVALVLAAMFFAKRQLSRKA